MEEKQRQQFRRGASNQPSCPLQCSSSDARPVIPSPISMSGFLPQGCRPRVLQYSSVPPTVDHGCGKVMASALVILPSIMLHLVNYLGICSLDSCQSIIAVIIKVSSLAPINLCGTQQQLSSQSDGHGREVAGDEFGDGGVQVRLCHLGFGQFAFPMCS